MTPDEVKEVEKTKDGLVIVTWEVCPSNREKVHFLKCGLDENPFWTKITLDDIYIDAQITYNTKTDEFSNLNFCAYADHSVVCIKGEDYEDYNEDYNSLFVNRTRDYLKEKDLLKKPISVRITWRQEITLDGKDLKEIQDKWNKMDLGVGEFVEISSIENADTYEDLESEWDDLY